MAKLAATTYSGLDRFLGERDSRTIGHNTVAERTGTTIFIRLHGSVIVALCDNGDVMFSLAGWPTVTTRERINQFLPGGNHVHQSNHVQYVNDMPIDSLQTYVVRAEDGTVSRAV